jgi:hypothetical protein
MSGLILYTAENTFGHFVYIMEYILSNHVCCKKYTAFT